MNRRSPSAHRLASVLTPPQSRWTESEAVALGAASFGAFLLWLWARAHCPPAISDDDFARVVIAQKFAQSPRLDPSGTSWLPMPFYFDGLYMMLRGATLEAAREAAGLRSVLSALLVFTSARKLGIQRIPALITAWFPFVWSSLSILTVATVPEYFTAALVLSASIGIVTVQSTRAMIGAMVALLIATLSRYEVWAIAFALSLVPTIRAPRRPFWTLSALLGPLLWCLHGALHHGDAFFFVSRVANYKAALGEAHQPWIWVLLAYPRALFELEPLLLASGAASLLLLRKARAPMKTVLWVGSILGFQVLALTLTALGNAAPTHHPERALLVIWLALPLLPALAWTKLRPKGQLSLPVWSVAGLAVGLGAYFQWQRPKSYYADRTMEVRIGQALRRAQDSKALSTVLATSDYGYFAIEAAAGHPQRFHIAHDHDPRRQADALGLGEQTRRSIGQSGASWLVLPICLDFIVQERESSSKIYAENRDFLVLGPR